MKRILLVVLAAAALPAAAGAQVTEEAIARAVLAAPARVRADVSVILLNPDGTISVLRQGTNGLMCWNNTGRPGYDTPLDVECTTEENRARLEQNHKIQSAGGTPAEIQARFDEAEAKGTRALSVFGSIYYRLRGNTVDAARTHTTVATPYATGEWLGVSEQSGPGLMYLMEAGTSSAHLLVSGV